jgi:hypothetical protein
MAPRAPAEQDDKNRIQSYQRMMDVLQCFSIVSRRLTLAQIAGSTGLPRPTVHRILGALKDIGFIEQDGRRVVGADRAEDGAKLFAAHEQEDKGAREAPRLALAVLEPVLADDSLRMASVGHLLTPEGLEPLLRGRLRGAARSLHPQVRSDGQVGRLTLIRDLAPILGERAGVASHPRDKAHERLALPAHVCTLFLRDAPV